MAVSKKPILKELNAYFVSTGFVIEETSDDIDSFDIGLQGIIREWIGRFEENKYKALFHLGFLERAKWFSPSVEYLYHISDLLIKKISRQSDIEFSRDSVLVDLSGEELNRLKEEVPFIIGMEHVDDKWLQGLWNKLLDVYRSEIAVYEGSVSGYFTEHNSNINVALTVTRC